MTFKRPKVQLNNFTTETFSTLKCQEIVAQFNLSLMTLTFPLFKFIYHGDFKVHTALS